MSAALRKGLVSGSVDASLEEIDNSSLLSDGDVRVGPFAVLRLAAVPDALPASQTSEAEKPFASHAAQVPTVTTTPLAVENLPAFPDDLLQWPDLFSFDNDLYGLTSDLPLDLQQDTNFTLHSQRVGFENETCDAFWSASLEFPPGLTECNDRANPQRAENALSEPSATRLEGPDSVLAEASFLLNIFQNHVVPRLTVVPLGQKTPWSILSVPAAIGTLGDITILNSPNVNHARQANLYSLLACAAFYVATTSSQQLSTSVSTEHWPQIAAQSYHDAKGHLRVSLSQETGGPRKAKYKEQLMAVFGIMECAVSQNIHVLIVSTSTF